MDHLQPPHVALDLRESVARPPNQAIHRVFADLDLGCDLPHAGPIHPTLDDLTLLGCQMTENTPDMLPPFGPERRRNLFSSLLTSQLSLVRPHLRTLALLSLGLVLSFPVQALAYESQELTQAFFARLLGKAKSPPLVCLRICFDFHVAFNTF